MAVDFIGYNEYCVVVTVQGIIMVVALDYSFENVISNIDTIELKVPNLKKEVPASIKDSMTDRLNFVGGYPTFL